MPFSIQQIRYAVTAADCRSFHRAARVLGVEQSSLGRQIGTLERVVGIQLFSRSHAGVVPTNAGNRFLEDARKLLIQADRMIGFARTAGQGRIGALTLGHNSPLYLSNLRSALIAWQEAYPDVEIERIEDNRDSLFARLDAGEIDMVVVTGDTARHHTRRAYLWSERVMIAMPTAHALANQEIIQWSDVRQDIFVLPMCDPGPEIRDMLMIGLSGVGFSPDVRLQAVSGESIMSVLGSGTALTVTRDGPPSRQYADVVLKEVHGERGQTLIGYSGYWRNQNESPALRRFLSFLSSRHSLSFEID